MHESLHGRRERVRPHLGPGEHFQAQERQLCDRHAEPVLGLVELWIGRVEELPLAHGRRVGHARDVVRQVQHAEPDAQRVDGYPGLLLAILLARGDRGCEGGREAGGKERDAERLRLVGHFAKVVVDGEERVEAFGELHWDHLWQRDDHGRAGRGGDAGRDEFWVQQVARWEYSVAEWWEVEDVLVWFRVRRSV